MQFLNEMLNYLHVDKASKFELFELTLIRLAMFWFNAFSDERIESWTDFCERFIAHSISQKRKSVMVVALSGITQRKKEKLRSYIE